jgi:hypothetical protein
MKLAEVVAFPVTCGDIAGQLRRLADELDAGEHGDVVHVVSVISGNSLQVRGWGKLDGMTAIATLNLGLAQMVNGTLAQMEDD